jgi:tetratricopeptide (TPR) repeat protein
MKRTLAATLAAFMGLAVPLGHAHADDDPPAAPDAAPAAPAPAAPPAPPAAEDPREVAKQHYQRGKTLQAAASYVEAIAEYEQGFALVPTPEFLFNIAQCYRLSGDKRHAVDYYRRYLDAAPEGKGAEAARGHIIALTREIDAEPEPVPAPATPAITPALVIARPPPSSPPLGVWQWTGISLGVSGLAAAALGTYFEVRARKLAQEVSVQPMDQWSQDFTDKYNEGLLDEKLGIVMFVGAGALVVGGIAAYWYGPRPGKHASSEKTTGLRLSPSASPGAVGMILDATF